MSYHYTMCGLNYVHLQNGYRIHSTEYGEGVSIEHADALDRAIAATLLRSHARLRGQEVRFLRGLTQRSQTEIAHRLGVRRVTVARWEAAPETPIPGPADRALRIDAAERLFGEHSLKMVVDQFPEIADARPAPLLMRFCGSDETDEPGLFPHPPREGESWHPAAAA